MMIAFCFNIFGIFLGLALFLFADDSTLFVAPITIWTILVLGYYSLFRAKAPGFVSWFAISYASLFLLFPAIRPFLPITPNIDPGLFVKYSFLAVTGCHLFLAGYDFGGLGKRRPKWSARYPVKRAAFLRVLLALFLINFVGISLKIISAGSLNAVLNQSRLELKMGYGWINNISFYLASFGSMFFPLLAAYVFRKRHLFLLGIVLVVIMEFFFLVVFRTRTPVVMHLTGLIMGWFLIGPRIDWGRGTERRSSFTLRSTTVLLLFLIMIGLSGLLIRTVRGQFNTEEGRQDLKLDPWEAIAFGLQVGDLNYSLPVMEILDQIPEHHDFLHGQSYYRLLFAGIPRSVWVNKPHNSGIILAQIISPGANEVQTIPAGVFGDLYANFSFWGILGMFFFGWAFRLLDRGNGPASALFFSVSFAMVFHFARGAFTNPVIILFIFWIVAHLVAGYMAPRIQE